MSSAQVTKLEALLARVQSRRLEPGLRLVDAPADNVIEEELALDEPATIPPPAAPASSLLTLDEPMAAAAVPVAAIPVAASAPVTRTTLQVDEDLDGLVDVDLGPASASVSIEPVEDALVTAVARPAPVMQLDEPPVAAAVTTADLAPAPSTGPVVMQAPVPVASGPITSFVGAPQRHALTFGELVGLAMSLTTR